MTSTRHASEMVERGVKSMEEKEGENDDFFCGLMKKPWDGALEGNEWALWRLLLRRDDVLRAIATMMAGRGLEEERWCYKKVSTASGSTKREPGRVLLWQVTFSLGFDCIGYYSLGIDSTITTTTTCMTVDWLLFVVEVEFVLMRIIRSIVKKKGPLWSQEKRQLMQLQVVGIQQFYT